MSTSSKFIQQVSAGEALEAKETVKNVLSNIAYEALSAKKQEVAGNVFNTPVDEVDEVEA